MNASSAPAPVGWPSSRQVSDLVIGALVPPVLVGLVVARSLADGLTQAGLASEQIFAGVRLPTLNLAPAPPTGEG